MGFVKYQHIERFESDTVSGISKGKCFIFPKIDGTNASIWMENGEIRAGSRNKELTKDHDNAGFYQWVLSHSDMFSPFFYKNPDLTLYGEWLVPHTIRAYKDNAWRNFYIFDVAINKVHSPFFYLPYYTYSKILDKFSLEYIRPQNIIMNPTMDQLEKELEKNHYLMENTSDCGEGIVIKNYDYINKFGNQIWAKIVRSEFIEKHSHNPHTPKPAVDHIEIEIAKNYVTGALVQKEKSKIVNESGCWESKYIPRLLNTVYYSIVTECMWDIVKKYKNPKIDFKLMKDCINELIN